MVDYSTKRISSKLIDEIKKALKDIAYGSVEIYVVAHQVTQITRRLIKKTNVKPKI
jgi:hypothetical protein